MRVGGDRIRRLRAIGAAPDALALRFTLERALRGADLRPRGVSDHAIVCIRSLRLPMPPPRAGAWAARLDREIEQMLPRGVRPFREAVPANAMVIVFADEAELLACLARDWHRGDAGAWWWRTLLAAAPSEGLVRHTFAGAPMVVPAAMELLAAAGFATDVVGSLPSSYCEQLGAAVAATFAVPAWTDWLQPDTPRVAPAQPRPVVPGPTPERVARLDAALAAQHPVEVGSLSLPQRALLGLTLLLHRDPALARAPGIGRLLRERTWWARPGRHAGGELTETTTTEPRTGIAPPAAGRAGDGAGSNRRRDVGQARDASEEPVRDVPRASEQSAVDDGLVDHAPDVEAMAITAVSPTHPGQTSSIPARHAAAAAPQPVEGVDTAFAGIVYLVNLALYLELYGDFTQPARPGLALPLGDFLALVAERACGASLRDDPVWDLLAQLAGRDRDEPPARDFVPPNGDDVARWLDGVVAPLESRAALALAVVEGTALPFLCTCAGRVVLSPTRLDAIFPLAAHPLAIRIAGLDRDPGWVPAAGRVITFHYE